MSAVLPPPAPAGPLAADMAAADAPVAHTPAAAATPADVPAPAGPAPDLAAALAGAAYLPSRKVEGWSAARQRQFLELVATGHSVEASARACDLSHQSAYAFRTTPRGAVFALGWRAALLLARERLADLLFARAFEGQTVRVTRADGSVVERHHHDNRLGLGVLARLDRLAEGGSASGGASGGLSGSGAGGAGAGAGGTDAARLVMADWDGFLALVEAEAGPARAGLFLARRGLGLEAVVGAPVGAALEPLAALARADLRARTGAGDPAELDATGLDPARRHQWTAADWARAEAAGLVALAPTPSPEPQPPQHSPADAADADEIESGYGVDWGDPDRDPVWWDETAGEWLTCYPPPAGFGGVEWGEDGEEDYQRTLTDAEQAAMDSLDAATRRCERQGRSAERDRWFEAVAGEARDLAGDADAPATPDRNAGDREGAGDVEITEHAGAAAADDPAGPGVPPRPRLMAA